MWKKGGGGGVYRYVKVDLIPRDVEEGGVGYRYVKVDLIHSGMEEGGGVGWSTGM